MHNFLVQQSNSANINNNFLNQKNINKKKKKLAHSSNIIELHARKVFYIVAAHASSSSTLGFNKSKSHSNQSRDKDQLEKATP
jgi:hypothetical protein